MIRVILAAAAVLVVSMASAPAQIQAQTPTLTSTLAGPAIEQVVEPRQPGGQPATPRGLPPDAEAGDRFRLWAELPPQWSQRSNVKSRLELSQGEASEVLEQELVLRLTVVSAAAKDNDDNGNEPNDDGREDGNRPDRTVPGQAGLDLRPVLRASIEKLTLSYTAAGETLRFDWPPVDEPGNNGGEGGGGDGAVHSATLDRIGRALAESVLEFQVGADGRARLVAGLESALLAVEKAEGEAAENGGSGGAARFLGALAPGAVDRLVTSMITLDPERRPREIGETWRTHFDAKALGREAQIITESTLQELEGPFATVRGNIKLTMAPARTIPGRPSATIADHSGSISARWDVRERRLVSHLWETRATWEMALATEPPIISRTTNTARIEITRLPVLPSRP